jgi:hypothetical protein
MVKRRRWLMMAKDERRRRMTDDFLRRSKIEWAEAYRKLRDAQERIASVFGRKEASDDDSAPRHHQGKRNFGVPKRPRS